jgi:mono/diheme cytochrome c family protein
MKTATMLAALASALAAAASARGNPPTYNAEIRAILSENCFACHGPDSNARQAGLRLDLADQAISEVESGARAIVPGDPSQSELVARVLSEDPDVVMPPPEAKLGRLSQGDVEKLQAWIAAGAVYEPHWTFLPPKSSHPAASLAEAVDAIVVAGLAERDLSLNSEADRATLIRRASFDLTGLPPTPAEVQAFVADPNPNAYEHLLDRLLASPRYGERMAADWLDLARYSDSYGFQVDRERPYMWPWRDWVIRSFNSNLPWDDFTLWQLAGDLLPNATDEQRLATAYNRLHQQEAEGGSVEEEYRVAYVNDRVTTFGTSFLGLTLEWYRNGSITNSSPSSMTSTRQGSIRTSRNRRRRPRWPSSIRRPTRP